MSIGDYYDKAKANWRLVLLIAFLAFSTVALFFPVAFAAGGGLTNLEYGLELDGGTSVRAPFVGMTAEGVDMAGTNPAEIEIQLAEELGVSRADIQLQPAEGTVEVFSADVTEDEFAGALQAADLEYNTIRDGVTAQTREVARTVIDRKIRETPEFPGGRVQIVTTPGGEHFMMVEAPGVNRSQVHGLISDRGLVEVVAIYPSSVTGNETAAHSAGQQRGFDVPQGYETQTLFNQDDLDPGNAQEGRGTESPYVPVTLDESTAQEFESQMIELGFTSEGVQSCRWGVDEESPGYCLLTVVDGEVVYSAGMGTGLAEDMNAREYSRTGNFRMMTTNMSDARGLQINLQAGALPTDLDLDAGTSSYMGPSVAERFKFLSLVTGIIAALTVALVVYVRYRNAKVSIPLFLTAMAEVYILLGFAAAIKLPLDLAHIAGFIAVIGTGVDDLIIIADEVLAQGDVKTRRVFESRFRKAFWVIGAAAVTTIIAMSPLTVLSLGDLSGFAVVTIVGVLIGVLVTRPAYGDVLRMLLTDK